MGTVAHGVFLHPAAFSSRSCSKLLAKGLHEASVDYCFLCGIRNARRPPGSADMSRAGNPVPMELRFEFRLHIMFVWVTAVTSFGLPPACFQLSGLMPSQAKTVSQSSSRMLDAELWNAMPLLTCQVSHKRGHAQKVRQTGV